MQKLTLLFLGIAAMFMFGLWQMTFVGAFEAQFVGQDDDANGYDPTVFSFAAAEILEPGFFDKPASHSEMTMALVQSDPETRDLDQVAQIRAAFALGDSLGHKGVLDRTLETAVFANGCEGITIARNGLQIAPTASQTARDLALAAMLGGDNSATSLRGETLSLAKSLNEIGRVSTEIVKEIEALNVSDFAITGSCSS